MFIGTWWSARRNSVISHCENGEIYGRQETSLVRSGVTTLASWCWRKLPCTLWEKPLKRLSSLTWWYLRLCVAATDPFLTGGFVQLFIQFIWILHTLQPRLLSIFVSVLFPHSFRTINASTLQRFNASLRQSDVPYGVLLSGGLDSSLVASIMSRNSQRRQHTGPAAWPQLHSFSIGLKGSRGTQGPPRTPGGAGHGREKP